MNDAVRAPGPASSADRIVVADLVGTTLFVVTAVLAAAIFTTGFQWIGAVTALALFVASAPGDREDEARTRPGQRCCRADGDVEPLARDEA